MINGIKPNVSNTTKTEKTMKKNGLSFDEAMDNYRRSMTGYSYYIRSVKKCLIININRKTFQLAALG